MRGLKVGQGGEFGGVEQGHPVQDHGLDMVHVHVEAVLRAVVPFVPRPSLNPALRSSATDLPGTAGSCCFPVSARRRSADWRMPGCSLLGLAGLAAQAFPTWQVPG